jgi:epoxyqueuosine reductase QueG
MDYGPPDAAEPWSVLNHPELGYVSRYALGRDYHKVLRQRLQRLAERVAAAIGPFGYRVFVDSAPVLEKALAAKAGLGLDRQAQQSAGSASRFVVFFSARFMWMCRCRWMRR